MTVHVDYNPLDTLWPDDGEGWTVYLPHQCENWEITEEYPYATRTGALNALKRFIAEAEKAFTFLEGQNAKPEERVNWDSSK